MSTPSAKRALNFGSTPAGKRMKAPPVSTYRLVKPEMKHLATQVSIVADSNLFINSIDSGPDVNDRIGVKVKIMHIEGVISCPKPCRVDILHTNAVSGAPTHGYSGAVDRTKFNVLDTMFFSPNTDSVTQGHKINHKLPYGLISKYNDASGANINKGKILARITTNATTSVSGYFRVWYTDS